MTSRTLPLLAMLLVSACGAPLPDDDGGEGRGVAHALAESPPGAAPGTCWGKIVTPAVIETVTNQVLVQSPDTPDGGTATTADTYKTETHQAIVREREVTWFETPCPADLTPDFVSSLQRALTARKVYRGGITGQMDAATQSAIRRFQKPDGIDSGILSLDAARKLGLVAVELPKE